jgi:hypothetical protein
VRCDTGYEGAEHAYDRTGRFGVRTAINEETDIDKMLGKLQFVSFPTRWRFSQTIAKWWCR